MEPLVALLLELGSRAKIAESRNADDAKTIAELQAKIEELAPKPEAEKKE